MKKKYWLFLIVVFILLIVLFIIMARKDKTPWWVDLEYSPPLLVVAAYDGVVMFYDRTITTQQGELAIVMNIVNNSDYWIQREGLGSFNHDPRTTMLEFFDGEAWRIVNTIRATSVPVSMALPFVPKNGEWEKIFFIEHYFGLLPPGRYRIRTQYTLYFEANLQELVTPEEIEKIRNLSRELGPHDVVAEFYITT